MKMISCKAGHFIPPHREHKGFKQRMGVASPQATGINGPSEPSLPPTACAALLPPPPTPSHPHLVRPLQTGWPQVKGSVQSTVVKCGVGQGRAAETSSLASHRGRATCLLPQARQAGPEVRVRVQLVPEFRPVRRGELQDGGGAEEGGGG